MAFCSECGNGLPEGARFCSACGACVAKGAHGTAAQTGSVATAQVSSHAVDDVHAGKRKKCYDGTIVKCPKCGEELKSFMASCPSCGYEPRGIQAISRVHELSLKLETVESDDKRADLIRNFYVPNTKEDIYEFFILATSNMNTDGEECEAWQSKLDQAYQKAELVFGTESEEYARLRKLYRKKNNTRRAYSAGNKFAKSRLAPAAVLFAVGVAILLIGVAIEGSIFGSLGLVGEFCILGAFVVLAVLT